VGPGNDEDNERGGGGDGGGERVLRGEEE
jgi:hypothetical protein